MVFIIRRLAAVFVALASAAALPLSWTPSAAAVTLSANTTALIMGGTFHPLTGPRDKPDFVKAYLDNAVTGHLEPAFALGSGPVTNAVAVYTPEDFFPVGRLTLEKSVAEGLVNLHQCVSASAACVYNDDPAVNATTVAPHPDDTLLVFGYPQSSVIASLEKRDLIDQYQPGDPSVSFMLIANPMRPNGGLLMRLSGWPTIPILGIPFPGASPTNSAELDGGGYAYPTVDVVRQYDGFGGDFPVRPLNLIALVNALLGYGLLHGETVDVPLDEARFQGREGDTSYYLIKTDIVPLLQPLAFFIPKPILAALDAPLRVVIEDAYDRDVGPGVPARASWWPVKDLVGMAMKLLASLPVAIDNLTETLGLTRMLGTSKPGTFGIVGPDESPAPELEASESRDDVEAVVPEDVLTPEPGAEPDEDTAMEPAVIEAPAASEPADEPTENDATDAA